MPIHPALLVIDVQKAFIPYMDAEDLRLAPEAINEAIALFRAKNRPVLRIYHTHPVWGPAPESPEFAFLDGIAVQPGDPQVVKRFPSAFKQTNLARVLADLGADTLFLCGLSATGCVLATYRGADDLDYKVFLVKGGLLSPKTAHTECVQAFCNTMDYAGLELLLAALEAED